MRRPRDAKNVMCDPPDPVLGDPGDPALVYVWGCVFQSATKLRRFAAMLLERADWLDHESKRHP